MLTPQKRAERGKEYKPKLYFPANMGSGIALFNLTFLRIFLIPSSPSLLAFSQSN